MHNETVTKNIETWIQATSDQMIEDEQYPMLLLSYKDLPKGGQALYIHRGSAYTNQQVIDLLEGFKQQLLKSSNG